MRRFLAAVRACLAAASRLLYRKLQWGRVTLWSARQGGCVWSVRLEHTCLEHISTLCASGACLECVWSASGVCVRLECAR